MEYITIYSTKDKNEIAVLERVYTEEGLRYRVENPKEEVKRIQVAKEDKTKARELLEQTGFLSLGQTHSPAPQRRGGKRWILIFLAAFILVIVIATILMFMNVE